MKILGEKSLSSKVMVGLEVLFAIISFVDVVVLGLILKTITHIVRAENISNNLSDFYLLSMMITTGIIALLIIGQFIKIFKNLKCNLLFCEENAKRLNTVSNSCFVISALYFIIAIWTFFIMNPEAGELIYYIFTFSSILIVIFVISGIGIKILNEIYKKAIQYKEENDLTI